MEKLDISRIKKIASVRKTTWNPILAWTHVVGINKKGETITGSISEMVDLLDEKSKYKKVHTKAKVFNSARGYTNTYATYKWSFVEKQDRIRFNIYQSVGAREDLMLKSPVYRLPLVAFDIDGNPVEGFNHLGDALVWIHKQLEGGIINFSSILTMAKSHGNGEIPHAKTVGGYQWMFYKDVKLD